MKFSHITSNGGLLEGTETQIYFKVSLILLKCFNLEVWNIEVFWGAYRVLNNFFSSSYFVDVLKISDPKTKM